MRASIMYGLAADLAAIAVLAHVIYFRRHRRRDLQLAYVAVNVGIFTVVSLLQVQHTGLAVGFGLFGVLSIIRLRSSALTQEEVGYYFVALALGLVNGLAAEAPAVALTLDLALLAVMYAADHPRLLARSERRVVTLDVVHRDDAALRADLERRLGGTVHHHLVSEVDYVRDVMVVDVRFRRGGGAAPRDRTAARPPWTASR